ncbi:hypothetical protein PSTG_04218 [Puccinia striiformis f. sp. tritici PST-78]|uniref:Uncharacterized protein n=1 Tax=Puccinia striiformis f. sp. tritici PST-78 TaxID=1165861 RepID=A0A0L0VTT8_9BASI|nr:hypothetical protein PSTG_04218 [Puccinia striiformis f. sp. tritici PST-78]
MHYPMFDDEDEDEPSEVKFEEDVVSQDKGHHGELNAEGELSLGDIHDLEEEDKEDVYTTASCCHTLAKFRAIATKLRQSPNSTAKLVKLCEENKCGKPHNVECDVPSRLNSTYKQVASISYLAMRQAVRHPTKCPLSPSQYGLGASAQVIQVIVWIDQITASLSTVVANKGNQYPAALQNACRVGLLLTNKDYSLTDSAPIYRIAMDKHLHPSFKDEYFKLAKWPKGWIDEVISLTLEMYDVWYKPKKSTAVPKPPAMGPPKVGQSHVGSHGYLSGGLVLEDGAPVKGLRWWVDQKRGGNTHHCLLQMALCDVLPMQLMNVNVQPRQSMSSKHSILADYVSARRHSLDPKTTKSNLLRCMST